METTSRTTSATTPSARSSGTPRSLRVSVSLADVAPRQATLLDPGGAGDRVTFDRALGGRRRHVLARGAWVDEVPGWARGSQVLFDRVVEAASWRAQEMVLFDEVVACPRLSARWTVADLPSDLVVLRAMAAALSQHYRLSLTQVSANLYRDGRDSVAWHGDRGARDRDRATIAVLSLGASRPFRLRLRDGHDHRHLRPASGDLLVMGGTCQRTWQHAVPKVADAGPRIAVMFRTVHDGA